jgi:hypothetical protein
LVGVVSGDTVTLNQSGMFASADAGTGIAVTATDSLSGASAGDYSIAGADGIDRLDPAGAGSTGGSSGLVLAALNARTQIVENFIYPQLGANPQVINRRPRSPCSPLRPRARAKGRRFPASHRGQRLDEDRRERHLEDRKRRAASAEQPGRRQ